MKISGLVYLGTADALVQVKILSEDLLAQPLQRRLVGVPGCPRTP